MSNQLTQEFNPLAIEPESAQAREYLLDRMRNTAREIVNSYHHTYDHLLEAVQNAVDACEAAYYRYAEHHDGQLPSGETYVPSVEVAVDLRSNEITVSDNGVGMSAENVRDYLFCPHATLKRGALAGGKRLRGEKGVGATFLAYGSECLVASTKLIEDDAITSAEIEGGIRWVRDETGAEELPVVRPCTPHDTMAALPHGTCVTIRFSEQTNLNHLSRHGLEPQDWEVILRLYTAIGYVDFSETDPFLSVLRATIKVQKESGEQSKPVRCGFLLPHRINNVTSARLSSLQRRERGRLAPSQRMKDCLYEVYDADDLRTRLQHRLESSAYHRFDDIKPDLYDTISRHQPRCYVLFAWSKEFWEEANQKSFRTRRREFAPGIVYSTARQRIAQSSRIEFSFRSGDYNRFFIVLDLDNVTGDIGRKSLPQNIEDLSLLIADTVHNEFVKYSDALKPAPSAAIEAEELSLEQLLDRAIDEGDDLPARQALALHLLKAPREEQDVIALFFDLLGTGHLKGYEFCSTHISQKYDAVCRFELEQSPDVLYHPEENPLGVPEERFQDRGGAPRAVSPRRSFLEFKLNLDDLIRDFVRGDKRPQDIRWVVCWEFGSNHEREGFSLTNALGVQNRNLREYYGVTHVLGYDGGQVHVLCLRDVLNVLVSSLEQGVT